MATSATTLVRPARAGDPSSISAIQARAWRMAYGNLLPDATLQALTPEALLVLRCVTATFPRLTDFGGKRPDPLPDHPSGRAVDIMIPNYQTTEGTAFGWQVAHWLHGT
jgi:hypothetical protein